MIPIIGRDELGLSPFFVGVLSSMEGFGALIGALMITRFASQKNFFKIYLGGTIIYLSGVGYLSILTFVAGGPNHSFYASTVGTNHNWYCRSMFCRHARNIDVSCCSSPI